MEMEEQAVSLQQALRSNALAVDSKLTLLNSLKSNIKHLRVPDTAQAPIFDSVRLAIGSHSSSALVSAGFATLAHLLKRLHLQNQTAMINAQTAKLLPVLLDRMGDGRESYRTAAAQSLCDLWPYCHAEVERLIRETALVGSNVRAKDSAMHWLVKMCKDEGLQFRSFVPLLVACLEDADGTVRETAKMAIVELFRNAPEHARLDLKKQLVTHNVRKTIVAHIFSQLGMSSATEPDLKTSIASLPSEKWTTDSQFSESVISESPPPSETPQMEPLYIQSQRELDDYFRDMQSCFEGRESEQNWLLRDKNVLVIRRLLKGNAVAEFNHAFIANIKSILDGILKVANSLRTTTSSNGCYLFRELARTLGHQLDPLVEILLQSFVKMCSNTKTISAQNGNHTTDTILANVSYNNRLVQHIWSACQDKNVQPRIYVSGWIKTLLRKHANQKNHIEHGGGLETLEKCIKRGLADANPKVREGSRSAYWTFASIWPESASTIFSTLDPKSKQLLEKDPGNPNAAGLHSSTESSSVATSGPKLMKSSSRSALKETIAAQKRAQMASRRLPERPTSAQATFSPVRQVSSTSTSAGRPTSTLLNGHGSRLGSTFSASTSNLRAATSGAAAAAAAMTASSNGHTSTLTAASLSAGSLMSAPLRRPRRPELTRPATADPYATRRNPRPETPTKSPANSPDKVPAHRSSIARPKARSPVVRSQTAQPILYSPENCPSKLNPRLRHSVKKESLHAEAASHSEMVIPDSIAEETATTMYSSQLPVRPFSPSAVSSQMSQDGDEPKLASPLKLREGISRSDSAASVSSVRRAIPNDRLSPSPGKPSMIRLLSNESISRQADGTIGIASPLRESYSTDDTTIIRADSNGANGGTPVQVRVYEDPLINGGSFEGSYFSSEAEKYVLGELPLNKRNYDVPASPSGLVASIAEEQGYGGEEGGDVLQRKLTPVGSEAFGTDDELASYEARTELLRFRRILNSAIERIKTGSLDSPGFRRVQELIKSQPVVLQSNDGRFSELVFALLDALKTPAGGQQLPRHRHPPVTAYKIRSTQGQVLVTMRALLTLYHKQAAQYLPHALTAIVIARSRCEHSSQLAAELEDAADDIVRQAASAAEHVDAILEILQSDVPGRAVAPRLAVGGLRVLTAIARSPTFQPSVAQMQQLGDAAVQAFHSPDPVVRKTTLDFCVELQHALNAGPRSSLFWKVLDGVHECHLNLIAYYIAKRSRP